MRPERPAWFIRHLVAVAMIVALVVTLLPAADIASAQSGDDELDGSPTSLESPDSNAVSLEEPATGAKPVTSNLPPPTLVQPVVLTIDTSGSNPAIDQCAMLDPGWFSVLLSPIENTYWTSANGLAGGNLLVDYATEPVSFSWDTLGGGSVSGVLVPDSMGMPAAFANFYDYRPFGSSVGGDAGLVAPGGILSAAYLCVVAPPAPSTEVPTEAASSTSTAVVETAIPSPETGSLQSLDGVQPAAIGVGSSVRVSESLNLRPAPSLSSGVITVLSAGTVVTVVGGPQTASGYTWWQLSTPSGTGWSVADFLVEQPVSGTATTTPSRTPTRTPTSATGGIVVGSTVRVTQLLNLRQGPGTSSPVVTTMPTGTIGTVMGGPQSATGFTWWQISTSLGTGWAAGTYLEVTSGGSSPTVTRTSTLTTVATITRTATAAASATSISNSPTATASLTIQPGGIAIGDLVRTTAAINLRSGPGTQASVITVLPAGTQGAVVGGPTTATGYTWWQIQTSRGTGWSAAPYLTKVGSAPSATSTQTQGPSATPTHTPTPSLTTVPSVTSTASQTGVPTQTKTATLTPNPSQTGTVTQTRTATRTATVTPVVSVTPTVGTCGSMSYGDIARTTSTVNFRQTPSTSGTIIRTLSEGERGTIKGGPVSANTYTWCQIQIGSVTGWVANSFLARVSGPVPTPNGTVTPRPEPPDPPSSGSAMVVNGGSSSSGMIALTFDAGAGRGEAAYILDVLADYGVKATFGMTGTWAQENPDLVARMVAEGHQLINHTWSHPSFTGGSSSTTVLTRAGRLDQLDSAEAIVEQIAGYQMAPYWRPPYGDINDSVLRDVYSGGYYVTVMWTCDTLAWNGASQQQIMNRCMYPMGAGDIILMHVGEDGLDWAVTDDMIEYFQAQGLQIVTVEELLAN